MSFTIDDARVAIVGLGLMGGSLAAALSTQGACRQVVGVARRRSTLTMALDLRFIHKGTSDLQEGVAEADIVVLATPVQDILAKIEVIGSMLKPGCLLMDVGSTKQLICQAMESLPPHVQPMGAHPMCGKETSGLAMADPALYRDRVFVLSPLARTSIQALEMGKTLARSIGARPLILDPRRHDRLVAAISHLPYLLAVTLVNAVEALAEDDPLVWKLAASGFRDTSRVAAGDLTMMLDILTTNRDQVLEALEQARSEMSALIRCLKENDVSGLRDALHAARSRRVGMF